MRFDVLLRNGLVFDGTGREPSRADVGVRDGRVAAVGLLGDAQAVRTIDLGGLAVCPGFVDAHSHADMTAFRADRQGLLEPLVRQGITTVVGGNCGVGMAPVAERFRSAQMAFYDFFLGEPQEEHVAWTTMAGLMERLETVGLPLNLALLAPHGMIRMAVLGNSNVPASAEGVASMKRILEECLEAGCIGMSTGLQYFPGLASDRNELVELGRVVAAHGGVFTSHLRSYNSDTIGLALDEVVTVARDAEVPVQVSHLFWVPNLGGLGPPLANLGNRAVAALTRLLSSLYRLRPFALPPIPGGLPAILDRIDRLVRQGWPIGVDGMPTAAAFTHLLALFPPWVLEGRREDMVRRLLDPAERRRIRRSIEGGDTRWPHRGWDSWSMNYLRLLGWDSVFLMSVASERNRVHLGKSLATLGRDLRRHPLDAACDLLLEEQGRVLIFLTATAPGDPFVEETLAPVILDRNVSIVTDAILLGFGLPSHLFYDCYPRFLERYVREGRRLSLPEAIRKCTSLPARQMRLRERGEVREGWAADLVVFDPEGVRSRSTAADPCHWPEGIRHVLINGQVVLDEDGYHPERKAGRLLRRGC